MLQKPSVRIGLILTAIAAQVAATLPVQAIDIDAVLDKKDDKEVEKLIPSKVEEGAVPQPAEAVQVKGSSEVVVPKKGETSEAIKQPVEPVKTKSSLANKRIRFALTLAGGGSRGAAHIGVLKVLEKEGLKPDFISGSSVGSLIGSLYAAGVPAAKLEELALNGQLKKAYFPRPQRVQSILYGTRYGLSRMMFMHPKIGLYSGKSIANFIEKNLPEGVQNFEDLKTPLAIAAVNVIDTKPVWFSKGRISTAVRASNTVPFMYRPIGPKDGAQLVDAGIRDNLPTDVAEAAGAPVVVAVKLHSYLEEVPRKEFDTMTDYADRITSILMAEIEGQGVSKADVVIEPKVQFMKLRSFNRESMAKAIAAGEEAARKELPAIKKRLSMMDVAKTADPKDL